MRLFGFKLIYNIQGVKKKLVTLMLKNLLVFKWPLKPLQLRVDELKVGRK